MGLISWIKGKYYDSRLKSGDNQLGKGNVERAEEIYRSILGKQELAVVHLSKLYVDNSETKEQKIERLNDIEALHEYVTEANSVAYKQELDTHVSNIYHLAQSLYLSKDYAGSVFLSNAIVKYKKNDSTFIDRLHTYKGYLSFSISQSSDSYQNRLEDCANELEQIQAPILGEVRDIQKELVDQKRYRRAIFFLLHFKSLDKGFKKDITDYIVQIISGNDSEYKNPNKITDFCTDVEMNLDAAKKLAIKANEFASSMRFKDAVYFDQFASEYLSNEDDFNYDRCKHILEEDKTHLNFDAKDISKLFGLAKSLKLSDVKTADLKKRTLEIASSVSLELGLQICRLFLGEKQFDEAYIKCAEKISKKGFASQLKIDELRKAIGRVTTPDSLIDALVPLVDHIQEFRDEFYSIVCGLYSSGNIDKAYDICSKIEHSPKAWLSLYLKLRNYDLEKITTVSQTVRFYNESINKIIATCNNISSIDEPAYAKFWERYAEVSLKKSKSQPKDKAIADLDELRDKFNSSAKSISDFQMMFDGLTKEIAKLRWSYAVELEEAADYDDAIKQYNELRYERVALYTNRAKIRSLICCVKGEKINADMENSIREVLQIKSYESLREDLAYRYIIFLLKHTRPADAQLMIDKYLPEESSLLALCKAIFIQEAESKLLEFNRKIDAMNKGTLSSNDAIALYKSYDSDARFISAQLPDVKEQMPSYKSKIEDYILSKLFNEESYSEAFEIQKMLCPRFVDNDKAFRNMAIASLGLLEKGEKDFNKIKFAISIWISAIYTDRLFVECLDYTSWDDQFTFTLKGSLGKTSDYDYNELPNNINFDNPVENQNIAIKDVQNSLLIRIETIIRGQYAAFEDFYNSEKEALDGLMSLNLDEKFIIASPYLSHAIKKVYNSISKALDYDYEQNYDNNEDVLVTGVIYDIKGDAYADYKATKDMAELCCNSLSGSKTGISNAFSHIDRIRDFEKLYSTVKADVSTKMNDEIKSNSKYDVFLDKYEIVCKAMKEVALSLTCANYVNGEVVRCLNDKTMKLRDGVGYLARIYNLAPNNVQVKQNLEAVLCSLARDCEEQNNSADINALNKALKDTGGKFNAKVEDARIQGKLNAIVEKVNTGKMEHNSALKAVYDLYKKCPDDERICENLATISDMCIMEYIIGEKYGSSSVRTILDSLNNNQSATFEQHNSVLGKRYFEILNNVPLSTKMLLLGNSSFAGQSLNSKGLALKEGLNYYKKLGGVHNSPFNPFSRSRLFDDVDDLPF